jgi:1,4-dihydroxy-6-naphthoate synthase
MQTIHIAISPCPNDTFIFENIYNKQLTIDGYHFQFHFLDINDLNKAATAGLYDVVKISFAHLKNITHQYTMLQSGGAMGYGVGPLLVKKNDNSVVDLAQCKIAIPGKNTTANFLFSYFYPNVTTHQKSEVLFSDIENAVLNNEYQLGVLIHEGRFTYQQKGLQLVADLGQLWEQHLNLPIPLGCIVAKKELGIDFALKIEQLITQSISNYDANGNAIISDFIKSHAKEMDEAVMRNHIDLYVNDFSKHMGQTGNAALEKMNTVIVVRFHWFTNGLTVTIKFIK